MKITQIDAFVFLKEARLGLSWFVSCCFLLGASLQIHSEDQGLVLVAPAYGIDKLYFDGYTFKVSFFLFISLDVEKFPYDPLKSCMCECKSIQWQSQMCAGPKKTQKGRCNHRVELSCSLFLSRSENLLPTKNTLFLQVCVGKWAHECTHTEAALHLQEKWVFSSWPLSLTAV